MRILALVNIHDEPHSFQHELAEAIAATVDHVIAVDGPYHHYPHTSPTSDTSTLEAACQEFEMGLTLHKPNQAWQGGEPQKRTTLFALAHAVAEPYDWLWVLDTDMLPTHTTSLADLWNTTAEVATGELYGDGNSRQHRMLFRAQPSGIHVQGHHANYVTGDGRTLWNPCRPNIQEPAITLGLAVLHRPHERTPERNGARLAYYDRARDLALENNDA